MIHQLDFNGNDKVDKAIMRLQAADVIRSMSRRKGITFASPVARTHVS